MGWVLAAGYKRADAVREEVAAVRAATTGPFGVNVFVPTPEPANLGALTDYLRKIAHEAERQGVELGEPRFDDDDWEAKLELVCAERPVVVSFTFGCPAQEVFERLHRAGIAAWVTIINLEPAPGGRAQARRRRRVQPVGGPGSRAGARAAGG